MIEALSPGPLVAVMAGAVALAALGHLMRVRILVAFGVMVVFAVTVAIMVGGFVSYRSTDGITPDPLRPDVRVPLPEDPVGDLRRGE